MGEKKVVDNEKKKKATRAVFVSNRKKKENIDYVFFFATVEEGKGISVERFDRRMLVCAAHETR